MIIPLYERGEKDYIRGNFNPKKISINTKGHVIAVIEEASLSGTLQMKLHRN
jgi:hypothetical protein